MFNSGRPHLGQAWFETFSKHFSLKGSTGRTIIEETSPKVKLYGNLHPKRQDCWLNQDGKNLVFLPAFCSRPLITVFKRPVTVDVRDW
jgi:hypothetical protein